MRYRFRRARQRVGAVSIASLAAFAALVASSGPALALDEVTFGTNWLADPEAVGQVAIAVTLPHEGRRLVDDCGDDRERERADRHVDEEYPVP